MSDPENSSWTKRLWQQGQLLATRQTAHWSQAQRDEADAQEKCFVFVNFSAEDEGRSRLRIARFERPEDAARAIACVNALAPVDDPDATMRETVDELTRLRNIFDGYVSLHLAKETREGEVKAERNAAHIRRIDALLLKLTGVEAQSMEASS